MASDNVAALPGVVVSEGKQTFFDALAEAYDDMTAKWKKEPVGVVFAFVNEDGDCRPGWLTLNSVNDRNILFIARGLLALQALVIDRENR